MKTRLEEAIQFNDSFAQSLTRFELPSPDKCTRKKTKCSLAWKTSNGTYKAEVNPLSQEVYLSPLQYHFTNPAEAAEVLKVLLKYASPSSSQSPAQPQAWISKLYQDMVDDATSIQAFARGLHDALQRVEDVIVAPECWTRSSEEGCEYFGLKWPQLDVSLEAWPKKWHLFVGHSSDSPLKKFVSIDSAIEHLCTLVPRSKRKAE